MKKSSTERKVPRKIGQDNDDDEGDSPVAASGPGSVFKRPSSKLRKSSTLRKSFGPSIAGDDEDSSSSSVVIPKRSKLSRPGVQRDTTNRSSSLTTQPPLRNLGDDEDRPSYSVAYLQELKDSTPTTPQNYADAEDQLESVRAAPAGQDLDILSKFGSSLSRYQHQQVSSIPSATEIAEKKARRRRLALEEKADEFISLDPSDPEIDDDDNVMRDEFGRLVLKPKDKYGETQSRLVREDEDIMENFDEFTEDGGISLGRKAEIAAAKRKKDEMAAQIAAAERMSDSDSDSSERERNAAFEAAQTQHGTYGQASTQLDSGDDQRPRTPPIISPIPTVDEVLERLRKQLSEMQTSRVKKVQELEILRREKVRIAEEELRIQKALKETAEKFVQLRKEKGIVSGNDGTVVPVRDVPPPPPLLSGDSSDEESSRKITDVEMDEDGENGGLAGLGLGGKRRGLGAAGLGMAANQESDSDDY